MLPRIFLFTCTIGIFCHLLITFGNSLDTDQVQIFGTAGIFETNFEKGNVKKSADD